MNQAEQTPNFRMETTNFEDMESEFDINAAFHEALFGVATDNELVLEEKVRRMEVIVTESNSVVYRDFVDFRSMASQMEMFCNHDHALSQATQGNETLRGFMDSHKDIDGHNHGSSHDKQTDEDDDDEVDPKTGKRRRRNWFGAYI